MWRYVANSVTGASHLAEGTPCQDCRGIRTLGEGSEQVLIACVADGAGSSRFGGDGASLACHAILDSAAAFLLTGGSVRGLRVDDARAWCEIARERIREETVARES
ncbi:MAG TPA: protein phosphatase 2C domain-containing protein, partial [Pirellulaceae bacterium]